LPPRVFESTTYRPSHARRSERVRTSVACCIGCPGPVRQSAHSGTRGAASVTSTEKREVPVDGHTDREPLVDVAQPASSSVLELPLTLRDCDLLATTGCQDGSIAVGGPDGAKTVLGNGVRPEHGDAALGIWSTTSVTERSFRDARRSQRRRAGGRQSRPAHYLRRPGTGDARHWQSLRAREAAIVPTTQGGKSMGRTVRSGRARMPLSRIMLVLLAIASSGFWLSVQGEGKTVVSASGSISSPPPGHPPVPG
jgi:hypothetical protein